MDFGLIYFYFRTLKMKVSMFYVSHSPLDFHCTCDWLGVSLYFFMVAMNRVEPQLKKKYFILKKWFENSGRDSTTLVSRICFAGYP